MSFWSTPDQDPKAAKFAVLIPGLGMFVNVRNAPRVMIPHDRCIEYVGMTAFPALFAGFSGTKKKAVGYGFVKG